MKNWIKKIIIFLMMLGTSSTFFLTWTEIKGVQALDGTSILTGNLILSAVIFGLFFVSVLFLEKARKVFFCGGLVSLCMLFSIMFSKFEAWGRFSNSCVGPYVGLISVMCTIAVYIVLFRNAINGKSE